MNGFGFAAPLRDALADANYTHDGVADLLGATAHAALSRNETTPGLRRTTGGSPIESLTRLFLLQTPVSLDSAEAALPGLVDPMCNAGLLEQSVSEVAARLDVRPYAAPDETGDRDLWVVSDLTPGLDGSPNRVGSDHVLGISSASGSLAQLTVRDPVDRALDLGTGCGVQALHLATHASTVVATDVNSRALWMTELNAQLNGAQGIEVRDGSLFEPVRGDKFDLITTNPPFVISPGTGDRLVYRDSGLPGDRVVEDIVRTAPDHLADGGWCQVLANWVIARDTPWAERLGSWFDGSCDALVVQREVVDPPTYVELWLRDAGLHGSPDYVRRYDTWLGWFDEQGIESVGFGWINLRKRESGVTEFLDWPYDVEQPIAPAIKQWSTAIGVKVDRQSRLVVRPDVQQETVGAPGAPDPETIVLRQLRGLRRARRADTVESALVGACDGDLAVGQIIEAVAQLLDLEAEQAWTTYLPVLGELVAQGFLEPSAPERPVRQADSAASSLARPSVA